MAENSITDWLFGVKQAQKSTNKTAPPIRGRGALPSKEARETAPNPRQPGYYRRNQAKPDKPNSAATPATKTASDFFGKPATSGPPFNPGGKRSVVKPGSDPLSANSGKRDWLASTKAPTIVDKPKPSRPAAKPAPAKQAVTSPAPAKQAVTSPAPSSTPKTNPTPTTPKRSWWDKFSDNHKLSADKSYADYKRLMGDN